MKRNNLQIQADLLNIARDGARKTRLVYQGNLNFAIIKRYLERLLKKGFMEVSDGFYFTTDKGVSFIDSFGLLMDLEGAD